ncbi:MAG: sensor histidine kinase [Planctomycetes bacterium]|nr:sensor histidine kinase [Planctomycetota bacterium]
MKFREFINQLRSWRLLSLVAIILALTLVHQSGVIQHSPFHQILDIVPYLPIILGAIWFGLPGGIACAVLTSLCYTTHLYFHEGGSFLGANLHRTLNILMFPIIGVVTGYLSQKQLEAMARYQKIAAELERSYAQLREKTEELFRNEEHLQRAARLSALGELTTGLAHEIGNPLGGIKGVAEILADGLGPGEPKHRFARLLLKEVKQLDAVVSRFLDFARPTEETLSTADVKEAMQLVASLCTQALKQGQISIDLKVEDDLPPVAASLHQLQQVFLNLLLNAIQATPPGGVIILRAHRQDDVVECVVKDNGRGIPPENLPRLFDPFFTTRPGGTGLGLAISHRIIEGCRGRISVESSPGQGAAFTVTLPIRKTAGVQKESVGR